MLEGLACIRVTCPFSSASVEPVSPSSAATGRVSARLSVTLLVGMPHVHNPAFTRSRLPRVRTPQGVRAVDDVFSYTLSKQLRPTYQSPAVSRKCWRCDEITSRRSSLPTLPNRFQLKCSISNSPTFRALGFLIWVMIYFTRLLSWSVGIPTKPWTGWSKDHNVTNKKGPK